VDGEAVCLSIKASGLRRSRLTPGVRQRGALAGAGGGLRPRSAVLTPIDHPMLVLVPSAPATNSSRYRTNFRYLDIVNDCAVGFCPLYRVPGFLGALIDAGGGEGRNQRASPSCRLAHPRRAGPRHGGPGPWGANSSEPEKDAEWGRGRSNALPCLLRYPSLPPVTLPPQALSRRTSGAPAARRQAPHTQHAAPGRGCDGLFGKRFGRMFLSR